MLFKIFDGSHRKHTIPWFALFLLLAQYILAFFPFRLHLLFFKLVVFGQSSVNEFSPKWLVGNCYLFVIADCS